jgi:parvulin-like peptidyl-prolyl isomerase
MSENETDKQSTAAGEGSVETAHQTAAPTAETTHAAAAPVAQAKSKTGMYIAAIVIVVATLLIVLFMLEKEGRSSTGVFDSFFSSQESNATVAVVNGEEVTGKELNTSIQQFNQAALAQGVDTTNPDVVADIRNQALEVLVNTTLLKQAAQEQGIEVSDEATTERLETIESEIGGAEVLQSRIDELGLTRAELREDIQEEILIQTLLDGIFSEADVSVTDEEIQEVYDAAGGVEAGLPPLEEVREQIEAQVRGTKEQAVIDEYLGELKAEADIEIKE